MLEAVLVAKNIVMQRIQTTDLEGQTVIFISIDTDPSMKDILCHPEMGGFFIFGWVFCIRAKTSDINREFFIFGIYLLRERIMTAVITIKPPIYVPVFNCSPIRIRAIATATTGSIVEIVDASEAPILGDPAIKVAMGKMVAKSASPMIDSQPNSDCGQWVVCSALAIRHEIKQPMSTVHADCNG